MLYALIVILPVAFYYLGSRALITRWLWKRYPPGLARFMDCAACSGFWYGANVAFALTWLDDGDWVRHIGTAILAGLVTVVTTPIVAAVMQRAIEELGSAVDAPPPEA